MSENIDRKISEKYCNRFGIIAVDKGFVTADQLKETLTEQADDNLSNKPHRLMLILLLKNPLIFQCYQGI